MEQLDPEMVKRKLRPILELPVDASEDEAELWLDGLTFTVTTDPDSSPCYFGERTSFELLQGGAERAVTLANKAEYVELLSQWYQRVEAEAETVELLAGVWEVLPPRLAPRLASVLSTEELSLLISGRETFSLADWRRHTRFQGFPPGALQPEWLGELLAAGSLSFRRRFLCFVTGATTVPLGGFGVLSPPFAVIAMVDLSQGHLPAARTCLNSLYLPLYSSKGQLEVALAKALDAQGDTLRM
jgi:hypothetical protein